MDADKLFNLTDEQQVPVRGSLLVARPTLTDPIFGRSVILMVDHDEHGSMGLMLNNYQGWTLKRQLVDVDCEQGVPVLLGGPVGMDQLFYIHTLGADVLPGAVALGGGLWVGGDFERLRHYLRGRRPDDGIDGVVKFCLGYSGWEAGQLQQEIDRHDWVVLDAMPTAAMMDDNYEGLWQRAVEQFGGRYSLWRNWPADPALN